MRLPIKWVGGPFDGHEEPIDIDRLGADRWVYPTRSDARAVYLLDRAHLRYRFAGWQSFSVNPKSKR